VSSRIRILCLLPLCLTLAHCGGATCDDVTAAADACAEMAGLEQTGFTCEGDGGSASQLDCMLEAFETSTCADVEAYNAALLTAAEC